jgi:hypothetical protein
LTDAADSKSVPAEQLQQAVADAIERGLVRRSALAAAAKKNIRISNALKRVR